MKTAFEHYKYLHEHPELSGFETCTSDYIFKSLSDMGYSPVRAGDNGVYADLTADPDSGWILFRADMDALPVTEETGLSCASKNPGVMHACGHDSHIAMLLEAASNLIHRNRENCGQNIRFLFQPAEENVTGAKKMIACGALPERNSLLACFAMHVWPGIPYGIPTTRPGELMASSDVYKINITGRSAHCAKAYEGADALQTAVMTASGFPKLLNEASDSRSILFCGKLSSGSGYNVVAAKAELEGTIRTYSENDRDLLRNRLEKLASDAADVFGTRSSVVWFSDCPPILNDAELVKKLCASVPGLSDNTVPSLAADDFARYTAYAPGVMIWMGLGEWFPLHSSGFYVPRDIIERGVDVWMQIADYDWRR